MTCRELECSTDVFTIELLDMRQHHRILLGKDPLPGLQIPMHLHRVQVEYELREKLLLLRQQLLLASGEKQMWGVLVRSVPSFVTLFRHALIALGGPAPVGKRQTVEAIAERLQFDGTAICQVLDVREHKADFRKTDVKDIFARYLTVVEQVTTAVDKALGADAPAGS
jgi:hypothetical protein